MYHLSDDDVGASLFTKEKRNRKQTNKQKMGKKNSSAILHKDKKKISNFFFSFERILS